MVEFLGEIRIIVVRTAITLSVSCYGCAERRILPESTNDLPQSSVWYGLLAHVGFSLLYATIAVFPVLIGAPEAAGGGIAETMAYLNGEAASSIAYYFCGTDGMFSF